MSDLKVNREGAISDVGDPFGRRLGCALCQGPSQSDVETAFDVNKSSLMVFPTKQRRRKRYKITSSAALE